MSEQLSQTQSSSLTFGSDLGAEEAEAAAIGSFTGAKVQADTPESERKRKLTEEGGSALKIGKYPVLSNQLVMSNKAAECTSMASNDGVASMDILPDICLQKVFGFLPVEDRLHLEIVSKRWQYLLKKSWANVKHVELDLYMDVKKVATLLQRCSPHILSAEFNGAMSRGYDGTMKRQERQEIHKVKDTFFSFDYPNLLDLNLHEMKRLDDEELLRKIGRLHKLESLNVVVETPYLRSSDSETDDSETDFRFDLVDALLLEFLQPLVSLKNLCIKLIDTIVDGRFLAHLPMSLEKLVIDCDWDTDGGMDMQHMKDFFRLGPRHLLTELRLTECNSDGSDKLIAANAENLRVLDLTSSQWSFDTNSFATLRCLKKLYLNYVSLDPRLFLSEIRHFEFLQSLRILHLESFVDKKASDLEIENLSYFSELRELSLKDCFFSSKKLEVILSGCKQMERLLIAGCPLDDSHLVVIGTNGAALTLLDISWPSEDKLSVAGVKKMMDSFCNSSERDPVKPLNIYARGNKILAETQTFSAYENITIFMKVSGLGSRFGYAV